ncbi:MAG: sugar ABC transporter substrate-binding protein [Cryobacterium sp.]|nr:sugar ABC transporter substrate-binding protein [Cryobacterium sp.]MBX3090034.1 sugar ABC transporter substrate-binding protein [Cryobacterium sp.]
MKIRARTTLAVIAAGVTALSLVGCSQGGSNDNVLRIAMGSPGEAQIRVWDSVADQFMKDHPDIKVEINYQNDDLYETIGLTNLLNGRNAPDIYFEWAGSRLEQKLADGFAADLTDAVKSGPIAGLFDDTVFDSVTLDGKIVMIPHSEDVTNVLWYNKQILADAGITPPTTWAELLGACDALNAKGIIPIASGNKDLWAAGNWLAHLASRVVGEDVYEQTLSGNAKFSTPEWEEAFGYVKELADHKCVNDSVNAIDDNEGAQLFFQGKAAMHAIGSWLVSWAIDEAPELEFDYVNLPAIPDGAGNQNSVIGVVTGYIVNAKSTKQKEAAEFLALLNSNENVDKFIEAELTPMAKSASEGQDIDSRSARLNELLSTAPAIVLPPDTGYNLEMANALYSALAEVLGGQKSPKDALAEIDQKLG